MPDFMLILRFIHEFVGIAWYGEVFFITFILIPTIVELPVDSKGPLMIGIFLRIFYVATVSSALAVATGAGLALLYLGFRPGVFVSGAWGLSILLGGLMGLFMFLLHVTVEVVELRALRRVELKDPRDLPGELRTLERRVTLLPRVGFVLLAVALVMMVYASHGL